jgi:hypothetical protein
MRGPTYTPESFAMQYSQSQRAGRFARSFQSLRFLALASILFAIVTIFVMARWRTISLAAESRSPERLRAFPRGSIDTSGYSIIAGSIQWPPDASLEEIAEIWGASTPRMIGEIDHRLTTVEKNSNDESSLLLTKCLYLMSDGKADQAYEILSQRRQTLDVGDITGREQWLTTIMYFQGVAALRRGENENCIMCRGESSCILPISKAAIHKQPEGSQLAIKHFSEYLEIFPSDLEVKWLLNLAHMTLGEHPDKVDPRYLISIDKFTQSQADIGQFRDIGHKIGVNRFNQAGGALMEDFDNDGLLDLAVTSFDPRQQMAIYRNTGEGKFEDLAEKAGVIGQLGGLTVVQTDYNNDGAMDIFIPRGAWLTQPMRPTLLRNDGEFHFTDVTEEAELQDPLNSNCAEWADYDNDGWVDLFIGCEQTKSRLYRNLGNGKFENVAGKAGVACAADWFTKGCTWTDFNNDDYPDLFVNNLNGRAQLYRNNRNGTFTTVTNQMGVGGPRNGFSCWSWDFNNDGWLDIFATCYSRTLTGVVQGLVDEPHQLRSSKLLLNRNGERFEDVSAKMGLDKVYATMGSNYGDFDNDGFLDMYLGTGEPSFATLVPNRMFKNMAGKRFVEITGTARVGNLQKGHGVACGDWDRDGNIDVFIEMGGAVDGDKYHNIMFQNPGHDSAWIAVKLVGSQTNRAALGARIKIVTDGDEPLTVHRHVSPGSSFGSNPLTQTIGLGAANKVRTLEVHWPTSGTTQVFHNLNVKQSIEITEFSESVKQVAWDPVPVPQ